MIKKYISLIVSILLITAGAGLLYFSFEKKNEDLNSNENLSVLTGQDLASFERKSVSENKNQGSNIQPTANLSHAHFQVGETKYELQFVDGQSLFEAMSELMKTSDFTFKSKTYTGIGEFVYSLNGIDSADSKYWILYINNEKAQVGVSDYKLLAGDQIRFSLEEDIYK